MRKVYNVTKQLYANLMMIVFIYGSIMLAIYFTAYIIDGQLMQTPIINMFYTSTHIFALVVGIVIAAFFLPFYVHNGITRKTFMLANTFAAFSMFLTLYLVVGVIQTLIEWFGNVRGDLSLGIPGNSLLLAVVVYAFSSLLLYVIGWMIVVIFKHKGKALGIAGIVFAIVIFNLYLGSIGEVNIHIGIASFTLFGPVSFPVYLLVLLGLFLLTYAIIIPLNRSLNIKAK